MTKTYQISDIDGRNKRLVTLEQYRAELDAAKAKAEAIARANYGSQFMDALVTFRKRESPR